MQTPVQFTNEALEALTHLSQVLQLPPGTGVRIGVKKQSGCDTPVYRIGFDEQQPGDEAFTVGGIPVLMQRTESMHLVGLTIDFAEGETEGGFIFRV